MINWIGILGELKKMKAWILSDRNGNESYSSLVFANTAGQAKKQANYDSPYLYQCDLELDYIDISCRRCKELDNCENLSEKEICLVLITEYGWRFYIGNEEYDEDNIDEFNELFK